MMSKTHIAVGVAASLAACRPGDLSGLLAAVIGGAVGGVICDIECHSFSPQRDTIQGRVLACGIAALGLALDGFMEGGIWRSVLAQGVPTLFLGAAVLSVACVAGHFSQHRTFTHSFLFLLLVFVGFSRLSPLLGGPALLGALSHVALDLLNKTPVALLYPMSKKGVCLRLCAADKTANAAFLWAGLAADGALLIERMIAIT